MDSQDWTPVVLKRKYTKKEAEQKGMVSTQLRDSEKGEKIRLAKLDNDTLPLTKKRVNSSSLQDLIRKRIELKLTQDKADALCAFQKHTFKDIESNKLVPSEAQKSSIQKHLGIQLKIDTIKLSNE